MNDLNNLSNEDAGSSPMKIRIPEFGDLRCFRYKNTQSKMGFAGSN
jgi:hypothetical protein